jgi:predicted DNA-binding transcriptional regulator AlpA
MSTFLKTPEAASALGLSRRTLEAWRLSGGGPVFRKFGRSVRYNVTDLEQFADERKRSSTSQPAGGVRHDSARA